MTTNNPPIHAHARGIFAASLRRAGVSVEDRVMVAFSGGMDSSVLVDLLHLQHPRGGPTPVLVHVDHQARPGSAVDARFCEHEAHRRGFEFHLIRLNDDAQISGQQAFRRRRLAAFARLAIERGITTILLGHHRDDRLETFMLNALRGSGLRGLSSMSEISPFPLPGSHLRLFRPLLSLSRAELEAFAVSRNLSWVEDSTNASDAYLRNRLRHRIFPCLHEQVLQTQKSGELGRGTDGLSVTVTNLELEAKALAGHAEALLRSARRPSAGLRTVALDRTRLARAAAATVAHLFLALEPSLDAPSLAEIHAAIHAPPTAAPRHLTKSRCVITLIGDRLIFEPSFARGGRDILRRQAHPLQLEPFDRGEASFFASHIRWHLGDSPQIPPHDPWSLSLNPDEFQRPLRVGGPPETVPKELRRRFAESRVGADLRWRWPCLFDRTNQLIWAAGLPRLSQPPAASKTGTTTTKWHLQLRPSADLIEIIQPQRN